ncbi:MAG: chromosomal replication initiator protein DnaA [Chloroflexota bacterium]|jgi:chromosomal replication initiator protein
MSAKKIWKATLGELEMQMTRATFDTWLKDTRVLSYEDDLFVIGVRNDYAKDWLENRLKDTILRALASILGHEGQIRFVVWSDELIAPPPPVLPHNPLPVAVNGRSAPGTESGICERFDFASFVVGPSNRLAHAAALSVAEQPGTAYNPLFIYGGVGLGKTHLLYAIGNKCRQSGHAVCYISSETFTNDLIQSIRSKDMLAFREKYRTLDVLLIDDIQFIAGKESTQEEMFHTFNELHNQGKQIVISSDRPPKAMHSLEERLQSRFEWGLIADVQIPDIETRTAILQTKAESAGITIPQPVLELISHHVRHNVRELEGALNKVVAYAQLMDSPVTAQLVSMALADLLRQPNRLTVAQVITAVCHHYKINPDELTGAGRSRIISHPRQVAMYLARTETDASLPEIGTELGHRDHTTILYGYEKIAEKTTTDMELRREIISIKSALYESEPAYY